MTAACTWHIAVPTYRRPDLLRRALGSLILQTGSLWQATVFDDSPDQEGRSVVADLRDARIAYVANPQRLGAAANIDACFGGSRLEGAGLGYVLEDDNFLLPGFLDFASASMLQSGAWMGLFNQRIWSAQGGLSGPDETTRGAWFRDGWVTPLDLHASLLLMEGLSNGGIVWRLGHATSLEVGPLVPYTSLHEACRSLRVDKPFWFSSHALAVWTANSVTDTARRDERHRIVSRGRQTITRTVLQRYGGAAAKRAAAWCDDAARRKQLVLTLLHAGFLTEAWQVDAAFTISCLETALKGALSRVWVADPCAEFAAALAAARP